MLFPHSCNELGVSNTCISQYILRKQTHALNITKIRDAQLASVHCIPMMFFCFILTLLVVIYAPVAPQTPLLHQYDASNQHALRSGKEVEIFLQYRRVKSLYFQLTESEQPVYIKVSPCGTDSLVKWKLTQQVGYGSTEPAFVDDKDGASSLDIGDWSITNTEGDTLESITSENNVTFVDKLHPTHISHKRQEITLIREVGTGEMEFSEDGLSPGVYHLYLIALQNASKVNVFFSEKSIRDDSGGFPELPKKPHLLLSNITTSSFRVAWVHSPSAPLRPQSETPPLQDIQYCLVLSQHIQFKTYCQLLSYQLPSNGVLADKFSEDSKQDDNSMNQLYQRYGSRKKESFIFKRKKTNMKTDHAYSKKLMGVPDTEKQEINCVRYKNEYEYFNLQHDTKYHLALFAVNKRTGRSVAYEGVSLVTEKASNGKFKGRGITLMDGSMVASYLNPARNDFKVYRFPVKHFQKQILIQVQPCAGYLRVRISKDGAQLWRFTSENLSTRILRNVKPGMIEIRVANDDHDAKIYKIWVSGRKSKNPYPQLPIDTSIKVVEDARRCRSVELEWLVTDEKQIYCLYKKKEEDDYFKTLILEESDQCQGPSANMQKSQCMKSSSEAIHGAISPGKRDPIMRTTVDGLESGTTYRFDLYASRPNRLAMSYRTVWVKTRKKCKQNMR